MYHLVVFQFGEQPALPMRLPTITLTLSLMNVLIISLMNILIISLINVLMSLPITLLMTLRITLRITLRMTLRMTLPPPPPPPPPPPLPSPLPPPLTTRFGGERPSERLDRIDRTSARDAQLISERRRRSILDPGAL